MSYTLFLQNLGIVKKKGGRGHAKIFCALQLTFPIGVVNVERRQLSVKLLLTKYLRIILAEDNLGCDNLG